MSQDAGQDEREGLDSPGRRRGRGLRNRRALLERSAVVRGARVGLWVLVVGGFLLGAAALAASGGHPSGDRPGPRSSSSSSSGAEGFAELYVSAFLQAGAGTEEDLRSFYPGDIDLSEVVPRSLYVVRAASLGSRPVGDGYWAVTVGAELLASTDGGYAAAGHRYFTVGVLAASGGYVATAPPAEIAGSFPHEAPELAAEALDVPADDAITRAVARFLDAYLAGQGELARYVAPGSGLRPISSSPYADAEVVAATYVPWERGQLARARVRTVDGDGRVAILEYSLELAERDGRWEVTRLLDAPPLQAP